MLGFLTSRGDGRAVAVGLAFAVTFSTVVSLAGLGWLPWGLADAFNSRFDAYYTGMVGNIGTFVLGFLFARLLPEKKRDLTNLTVWTQEPEPIDEVKLIEPEAERA